MALDFYKEENLQQAIASITPLVSQDVSSSWHTREYTYQEGTETKTIRLAYSDKAYETISSADPYTMIAPEDAGLTTVTDDYTYIYSDTGIRIGLRMVDAGGNGGYYQITYPEKKVNGMWDRLPVWSGQMLSRWTQTDFDNVKNPQASNYTIMKGFTFTATSVSIEGKRYTCLAPVVVCAEASNPGVTLFRIGDHIYVDQEALSVGSTEKPDAYKPKNNVRSGGRGTGGMSGAGRAEHFNVSARNSLFGWASATGKGLTYWWTLTSNLHDILAWAYSWGICNDNSYIRSALVSAFSIPGSPQLENVPGGGALEKPIQVADKTLDNITGGIISRGRFYSMGEMKKVYLSSDANGDFSDFTNMEIQLILPFVGMVNLDPKVCAGSGTIFYVEGWIDAYTGNVLYYVYTKTAEENSREILYGTYSGNAAVSLPLVGGGAVGSYLQNVQNKVSNLATGIASVASATTGAINGNASAAAMGLAGAINSAIEQKRLNNPPIRVDKGGTVDPNASAMLPHQVALNFSIPVRVDPANYAKENGVPSCIYRNISELLTANIPGRYTFSALMVDDISDASEAEKQKIRSILMNGVIIA